MKTAITGFIFLFLFTLACPCQAEVMSSSSFSIQAAGFSCGGIPAAAKSFKITSTLGQAAPVSAGFFSKSPSFRNFPGLRYQLEDSAVIGMGFLPSIYQLLLLEDK